MAEIRFERLEEIMQSIGDEYEGSSSKKPYLLNETIRAFYDTDNTNFLKELFIESSQTFEAVHNHPIYKRAAKIIAKKNEVIFTKGNEGENYRFCQKEDRFKELPESKEEIRKRVDDIIKSQEDLEKHLYERVNQRFKETNLEEYIIKPEE